ncbi:ParB N-terminal domain-containing protein [Leucobacter sp. UCMA 4100]|uniref:ParB N-terminal domain-containing protein n=1 Tax=Leucobacter sp. UCMA 4100 TaxID=2810534 RepID=UPI0022EB81C5|nr:ParB N-terminal domain-containing protein [Leucobacter sp. UCMA 4100]MDA3146529.1 ParB N-terminal domain-containing protein [Leucobacter sp. UCMA 4100]
MSIISKDIKQDWQTLPIESVIVEQRLRDLNEEHVQAIMRSFKDLGGQLQLQPIVVDQDFRLADGAHRLEAAKRSGWEHISALVVNGVNEQDRRVIEVEANRLRLEFTMLELHDAWQSFYEPEHERKATARKTEGARELGLGNGNAANLIGNSNKVAEPSVSKATAAKESVGLSIDTLNKIKDIKEAAQSDNPELREAALSGLKKLNRPGAAVNPVHKSLLALQSRIKTTALSPDEAREKFLDKRLSSLVEQTTGLSIKLAGDWGSEISEAASESQLALEDLRGSRKALTKALMQLMVIEVKHTPGDPGESLRRLGSEVSRQLAEESLRLLNGGGTDA